MGLVLPVYMALPRSRRGPGATSSATGSTASLNPPGSTRRLAHVLRCARYQLLAAHSKFSITHCCSLSSPAMPKLHPYEIKDCTIWLLRLDLFAWTYTSLTLQKDPEMGTDCPGTHFSHPALPKRCELLGMQVRIMIVE